MSTKMKNNQFSYECCDTKIWTIYYIKNSASHYHLIKLVISNCVQTNISNVQKFREFNEASKIDHVIFQEPSCQMT